MTPKTRVKELLLNPVDYNVRSIAALERKLNISNGTISKWDKVAPSAAYAQAVAEYFGVSVDYLLGNTDEIHPSPAEKLSKTEEKVGGLFRKYTKENNLSEKEKEELAEDLDDYIAMRAKRLRAKKTGQ
ncbi:helix-turn-helix domain-containing protein [Weissella confusa]|uniref:helix-turn-helix domain-containing protein n=1 Tax=Weissella confusa TaxID=1583 RepID=UPI001C6FB678|nr:helix-turn-helix transcriptional regulator [Weissella confusa]QYU58167.1 helix-turn-helix domain-containing protein [Weissella confusa]